MARELKVGERAIVELKVSEVYEGDVAFLTETQITLANIYFRTKHCSIKENLTFFKGEVQSIKVFKKQKDSADIVMNGTASFGATKIKLQEDEFYRVKEMGLNYTYLSAFNTEFFEAVNVLSNCESVGIVGLGISSKTSEPLSLLLMCSFKKVYVFDVKLLITLNRLREVLESEFITKVVHDGRALFDTLFHKYGITIRNLFDTQVADSMLSKRDEGVEISRDIAQCLTYRLNFPATLLAASMEHIGAHHWMSRPLTKSQIIMANQLLIYILSLRDTLNKLLLNEFFDHIDKKYSHTTNNYDFLNETKTLSLNFT